MLRNKITTVPHLKPRGRPKHTGTLWPSKKKSSRKRPRNPVEDKENVPATHKKQLSNSCRSQGTPAYHSLVLREQNRSVEKQGASELTIVDDSPGLESPGSSKNCLQISEFQVYDRDLNLLHSNGEWLNDTIVNAGQALIRKRFPNTCGLQDVSLSRTLAFQPETKQFIQVLNCRDSHWVCATNIECKPNVVKIYDSMRTGDLSSSTKDDIAALLQCTEKRIFLLFPEVQQQRDGSSCGLFALAFACTLAEGKDPSRVVYPHGSTMCSHLLKCILGEETLSFHSGPSLDNPSPPPLKSFFKIYCSCRLLDHGDVILCDACKEWYHLCWHTSRKKGR